MLDFDDSQVKFEFQVSFVLSPWEDLRCEQETKQDLVVLKMVLWEDLNFVLYLTRMAS
jgi:hypothetical protein